MLEMRITIEAPELVGALNNLAAAMGGAKLTPQQGAVAAPQQPHDESSDCCSGSRPCTCTCTCSDAGSCARRSCSA